MVVVVRGIGVSGREYGIIAADGVAGGVVGIVAYVAVGAVGDSVGCVDYVSVVYINDNNNIDDNNGICNNIITIITNSNNVGNIDRKNSNVFTANRGHDW